MLHPCLLKPYLLKPYLLKPSHRRMIRSQRGLTLIEIIVVLVILAIMFAFLTSGLFSQAEGAKMKLTEIKLHKLKSSIDNYQLMNNSLPNDLNALVNCSGQAGAACVPVAQAEDLKDAWGSQIDYRLENSGRTYSVRSLGADRREGGSGVNGDLTITGP